MAPAPQPYDLIDVATLAQYANLPNLTTDMEDVAQSLISGFSMEVCNYAGRAPGSFNGVAAFAETYDGNGNDELFVANAPIVTIASLDINGILIPQSVSVSTPGWYIPRQAKSVVMRTASTVVSTFSSTDWAAFTGLPVWKFWRGRGNVQISYTAGYSTPPTPLVVAALKQCTIWLNRRMREDEKSRNMPQSGTTSYAAWNWSPDVYMAVSQYRRMAQV